MKKSLILVTLFLITLLIGACLDEVFQEQDENTASVVCQIGITKAMEKAYRITQVRLTIYQGSTTVWGPNTYDYNLGQVDVTGVPPGDNYYVLAEVLDSSTRIVCTGQSGTFSAVGGEVTNAGYISLGCLAIVLTIQPDPVPYDAANQYWSWEEDLEEKAGVPATFVSGYYEARDQNYELITNSHNEVSMSEFQDWYGQCDNNNGTIGALGHFCSVVFSWNIWDPATGGYYVEYFRFRDDHGQNKEITLTVQMLARN